MRPRYSTFLGKGGTGTTASLWAQESWLPSARGETLGKLLNPRVPNVMSMDPREPQVGFRDALEPLNLTDTWCVRRSVP